MGENATGRALENGGEGHPFLSDVKTLRERVRRHIEAGAITATYQANRETVLKLLNEALATEIARVLRYKRHYFMAQGRVAQSACAEFLEHAVHEQAHADQIAERIVQLGGEPDFSPAGIVDRSHAEYAPGCSLLDIIREDVIAGRIAIDSYREMILYIGDHDTITRHLLEEILAAEEQRACDMAAQVEESSPSHSGARH